MTTTSEITSPQPARVSMSVWRGDSLGLAIRLWADADKTEPADLSQATVRAQVRETTQSSDAQDFEVSVTDNLVTLHLLPKSTQDLADSSVWDCQVDWYSDEISVQTVVAGVISASGDVTR